MRYHVGWFDRQRPWLIWRPCPATEYDRRRLCIHPWTGSDWISAGDLATVGVDEPHYILLPRELATRIYDRAQRYQAVALAIDRYFYLGGLRPNLDFVESPSLLGMPRTFDHQNRGLLGLQLQVWEWQGYIRWVLGSLPMDWRNTPLDIRGWDWRQFLQGENLFTAPSVGAVVDWSATPGNVRPNLEWFH